MNNEIDTYTRRPTNQDNKTQINKKVHHHNQPKKFGIQAAPGQLNGQPDNDCVDLHAKTGLVQDTISGTLQGSDINISVKEKFGNRTLNGSIKGNNFELNNISKFTNDKLTGNIGDAPVNLNYELLGVFKGFGLNGNIGNKNVNLTIKDTLKGKRITGNFEGKNINLLISSGFTGKTIQDFCDNKNVNLKVNDSGFLKAGYDVKGTFNGPPDMVPILFNVLYNIRNDEEAEEAEALNMQFLDSK